MFELIVLTEETRAEAAAEDPSAMVPDPTVALDADRVLQGAGACVRAEAVFPVADPGFTEITDGSDHLQSRCELARVFNDTVTSFLHAFLLAALGAHRKSL